MNLYGLGEQRIHQIKEGHEDRRKDYPCINMRESYGESFMPVFRSVKHAFRFKVQHLYELLCIDAGL